MNIRAKNGDIRITNWDGTGYGEHDYVSVKPMRCYSATFNSWGKPITTPVVQLDGRTYKVVLEEVK